MSESLVIHHLLLEDHKEEQVGCNREHDGYQEHVDDRRNAEADSQIEDDTHSQELDDAPKDNQVGDEARFLVLAVANGNHKCSECTEGQHWEGYEAVRAWHARSLVVVELVGLNANLSFQCTSISCWDQLVAKWTSDSRNGALAFYVWSVLIAIFEWALFEALIGIQVRAFTTTKAVVLSELTCLAAR